MRIAIVEDIAEERKLLRSRLETQFEKRGIYAELVEFENGERLKLRNLNAHKMILSAGDVGILRYKGMTIEAFQREGMRNQNTHQFGSWG